MVKTPRTRHSKTRRDPVTLDLEAQRVSDAGEPPASPIEADAVDADSPSAEQGVAPSDAPEPARERIAASFKKATGEAPYVQPQSEAVPIEADAYQSSSRAGPENDYRFEDETPPGATPAAKSPPPIAEQPSPVTPPARPGGLGRLAAGLIGGVAALVLAGLLQFAGLLGTPSTGTTGGDWPAEAEALRQQIAALRDAPATGDPAPLAADVATLKTDVAALRDQLAAAPAGAAETDRKLAELETRVAALGNGSDPAAAAALGDRIAAVEALVKSAGESLSAVDGRLSVVEQALTDLKGRVDSQAAQPKIALAIATAALKSAVDRGAPFLAELETFAAIVPEADGLETLRSHAERGVPTREQLLAEVEPAAAAMIASARPVDPDAGIFDRLLSSAESLVSVRPIGAVEGEGVPATVARLEVALRAGDLAKAAAEFDALPDTAKTAGAAFGERLKARVDVEALVDQTIAAAMRA